MPHSEISGSKLVDSSPKLIAVFRVLHRLLMPRHPSCARIRLARIFLAYISIYVAILLNFQLPVFKDQINRLRLASLKPGALIYGGGRRIRTDGMLLAKQPLYQLSYTPFEALVGLTRIELVTSSLSGTRSNQLSYKPTYLRKRNGTECLREAFTISSVAGLMTAQEDVSLERR